jgi:hypothetical protein
MSWNHTARRDNAWGCHRKFAILPHSLSCLVHSVRKLLARNRGWTPTREFRFRNKPPPYVRTLWGYFSKSSNTTQGYTVGESEGWQPGQRPGVSRRTHSGGESGCVFFPAGTKFYVTLFFWLKTSNNKLFRNTQGGNKNQCFSEISV